MHLEFVYLHRYRGFVHTKYQVLSKHRHSFFYSFHLFVAFERCEFLGIENKSVQWQFCAILSSVNCESQSNKQRLRDGMFHKGWFPFGETKAIGISSDQNSIVRYFTDTRWYWWTELRDPHESYVKPAGLLTTGFSTINSLAQFFLVHVFTEFFICFLWKYLLPMNRDFYFFSDFCRYSPISWANTYKIHLSWINPAQNQKAFRTKQEYQNFVHVTIWSLLWLYSSMATQGRRTSEFVRIDEWMSSVLC